jgi:hypothetical protein
VKERKGPFGLVVGGIVDSVVQTARRRTQDREPRALVYGADGRPRLVRPGEPGGEALIETAGRLIDLVGTAPEADELDPDDATEADARAAGIDGSDGEKAL